MALAAAPLAAGCALTDPCDGVDCGNGVCVEVEGDAACDCDIGYHPEGLQCVLDTYTVSVDWAFPGGTSCVDELVGTVHVELFEDSTLREEDTFDCTDEGVVVENLVDGVYTIDLTAISNLDEDVYFASLEVTVSGQNQNLGTVTLDPIGQVTFTWDFEGMDCSTAGVGSVSVIIDDADGNNIYDAYPLPSCEEGGHTIGNFFLGSYNLTLEGFCSSDHRIMGYLFEAIMPINKTGLNGYGLLSLDMVDSGCPL